MKNGKGEAMNLTVRDYKAIASSRFLAKQMRTIVVGLAFLVLWLITIAIVATPTRQDTIYIAPSGVEAVKPYGERYLVIDKTVWLAEEKEDTSLPTDILLLLPLLFFAGGAIYLVWQEDKAKAKMVEEHFIVKE